MLSTPADDELIARARQGDGSAYGMLVRRHQDIAFRTACLVTGSAADAEDAAQDAFVKAWRALGRFRSGAPFRPWLLQIVVNEARNRNRSAGRRAGHELRLAAEPRAGVEPPEHEAQGAEERRELLAALGRLREDDRLVISCRYLLELSEEETAAALGLRRGTVKSRLSRALARMRAELGEEAA